jgi:virulence-associated protein VagC
MERTKIFKNGGSLAVRLPKKYALPVGDVMIDQRDGMLVLLPLEAKDWPDDLESRLAALADLEMPARAKDSKPVNL